MRRASAVLLLLVLLVPAVAGAETPAELTKRGLELRRERRDAEALADFRRAYAIEPAPRTLAQIALAEQALGRWADAEADLQSALGAAADPWIAAHGHDLSTGLTAIQSHLGALVVEADVAGAEVLVNGAHAGVLPLAGPLRVEAGTAVVEVRAEGYASARRMTSVEPGGSAREVVHLVPLAVAPPPSPEGASIGEPRRPGTAAPTPEARPSEPLRIDRPLRAASIVLLGAGFAGLAAGTYFGVRTLSTKSDRDGHCSAQGCDSPGVALDQEARSLAGRSTAWLLGGLAAAGLGFTLFVMSSSRTGEQAAARRALSLRLDFGPDRANATVRGAW
jgi:hypothetical protein